MPNFDSPYIIPVVAMLIPIVAIISGVWGQAHARRTRAEERMAMLARGIPLAEIEAALKPESDADATAYTAPSASRSPARSLGNARRAAVVLISVGLGLIVFFVMLASILREHDILAGAAVGVIPLAIGVGFVVDYTLQRRELARFGLEIDPGPPRD